MFCLALLLTTASIIITNAIPFEGNSLPFYEYPEEIKEHKKQNKYFTLPKSPFEFRQSVSHSYSTKRDSKQPSDFDEAIVDKLPTSTKNGVGTQSRTVGEKDPNHIDDIIFISKRTTISKELYDKLIALGLDNIDIPNFIEAMRQYKVEHEK